MRTRSIFIAASIVLLVVLGVIFLSKSKKQDATKESPASDPNVVELGADAQRNAKLTVVPVTEESLREFVKTTGVVAADESRVAHIFPLAQGVVEKPFVRLGDRVKAGQPLLLYDNIELGETVGEHLSLHGALNREIAQQEVAKKALERANALIQAEAISPREYEMRKAEQRQAEAAVQSKEAELARSEEKLHRFGLSEDQVAKLRFSAEGHRTASHNILRAPFAGIVEKYDVAQGETVTREKELFTVIDTSAVWVQADVYEKDIGRISKSGSCQVTVASYPNEKFEGTIGYVSDFLDPESRTAKVRCVVDNKLNRLKLQMFADILIPVASQKPSAVVPSSAIQDMDGESVVFVRLGPSRFEKRVVKLGQQTEDQAQVIGGVRVGENVVAKGSFYLKSALLRERIGEEE